MRERIIVVVLLATLLKTFSFGQQGVLKGTITDEKTGETLIGATVLLEGSTKGSITDFDGNYTIPSIAPGTYNIICSYVSYETQVIKNVKITNEPTELNFVLSEALTALKEVKVVGRANRESEVMLLMEQKKASVIKESIGAQQLANMGVSDAASATTKISGVAKTEGSGDIYVRGLGDRYMSTTMNRLPVPSDNIDKKNINLDIFTTDVINNVGISKTYSTSNYADLTSGNVDVETKILTRDKIFEIGIAGGINTGVLADGVSDNFKATQNYNDISHFGYYKQPYELEESIPQQSWNATTRYSPINHGFSFIAGRRFMLFNREFSVLATAMQSSNAEYREGVYNKYRMNDPNKQFNDVESYRTNINTNGLLNINYAINANHNISYNLLYVHKLEDELYEQGRNKEGYIRDFVPNEEGVFVRDQITKQTQIIINQLIGRHTLSDKNELKWALGYNIVDADEPNRFRNEVAFVPEIDRWKFGRVSNFHIKKSYQEIKDNEINGYINDLIKFADDDDKKLNLTLGADFRIKNRSFNSLSRGVRADIDLVSIATIDNMDEALLDESLYESGALRIDKTLPEDLFDATLSVYAGYADLGFDLNNFSGSFGLRYEIDQIDANWDVNNYIDHTTGRARIGSRSNTYQNVLPALNLKYQLAEKNALRFAASKTITLPEFKEISPFEYVSPEGDVTKGNEELKHSENYNLDVKWEFYPSAKELVSVTGFYKQINDPINLALTRGSSGYFKYDNTGDQATVYGIEIETRFGLVKSKAANRSGLDIILNGTRMWFQQDLLDNFQYNGKTESGLEGASEIIVNGSLHYTNNRKNQFDAAITANYSSDKIFVLGAPESQGDKEFLFNSEIIEKGFTTLDLVLSQEVSERITIKFRARNLLDPTIERTQFIKPTADNPSTEIVNSYKKGINLSLGIKIKLN